MLGIEIGDVDLLGQADAVALVVAEPRQLPRLLAIGPSGIVPVGEERRRGVEVAAGGDGDELVELPGDDAGVDILVPPAVALVVEAGQQRHGQAVVEAVTLAPDLAVANDELDAAVEGARADLVGDAGVGELLDRRVQASAKTRPPARLRSA